MIFSEEILVKDSRESNKFIYANNKFKLKTECDLQIFSSKNYDTMNEISEEIIDTLDNENLRSILKAKCRANQSLDEKTKSLTKNLTNFQKEEKEKSDEMRTIIRLQKKEIVQNNKYTNELQKELNCFSSIF